MNIQNIGNLSYFGNTPVQNERVQVKDAIPALANQEIKVDISKEGLEALRKQVQEMPGAIDWEKEMRIREILPKVQMDPVGSHYEEMSDMGQAALAKIKERKENYDLEDLFSIRMESYAAQYHKLVRSHEDGSRDIYVADGVGEYHKVEKAEDLEYLSQAFDRTTKDVALYAGTQEQRWKVRHTFYGEPELDIELPENYQDRIVDLMKKAQKEFEQKYESGSYTSEEEMVADAKAIGSRVLREDTAFWNSMERLFERV